MVKTNVKGLLGKLYPTQMTVNLYNEPVPVILLTTSPWWPGPLRTDSANGVSQANTSKKKNAYFLMS